MLEEERERVRVFRAVRDSITAASVRDQKEIPGLIFTSPNIIDATTASCSSDGGEDDSDVKHTTVKTSSSKTSQSSSASSSSPLSLDKNVKDISRASQRQRNGSRNKEEEKSEKKERHHRSCSRRRDKERRRSSSGKRRDEGSRTREDSQARSSRRTTRQDGMNDGSSRRHLDDKDTMGGSSRRHLHDGNGMDSSSRRHMTGSSRRHWNDRDNMDRSSRRHLSDKMEGSSRSHLNSSDNKEMNGSSRRDLNSSDNKEMNGSRNTDKKRSSSSSSRRHQHRDGNRRRSYEVDQSGREKKSEMDDSQIRRKASEMDESQSRRKSAGRDESIRRHPKSSSQMDESSSRRRRRESRRSKTSEMDESKSRRKTSEMDKSRRRKRSEMDESRRRKSSEMDERRQGKSLDESTRRQESSESNESRPQKTSQMDESCGQKSSEIDESTRQTSSDVHENGPKQSSALLDRSLSYRRSSRDRGMDSSSRKSESHRKISAMDGSSRRSTSHRKLSDRERSSRQMDDSHRKPSNRHMDSSSRRTTSDQKEKSNMDRSSRHGSSSRDYNHGKESSRRATTAAVATTHNKQSFKKDQLHKQKKRAFSTRTSLQLKSATLNLEEIKNDDDVAFLKMYQLGSIIYDGDFCRIQECIHLPTGTSRAVKIVREDPTASFHPHEDSTTSIPNMSPDDKKQRKCHEFEILRQLDTRFVPNIYKLYEHNDNHVLVMERCYGENLRNQLHNTPCLKEDTVMVVMKQIIQCLQYLHDKANVVHCDLRPCNIVLQLPNHYDQIKVVDFDTAVKLSNKKDKITEKRGGGTGLHVVYHAPEVHRSHPRYDAKADLWSCGVLMYRMLYGILPFVEFPQEDSEEDVIYRMKKGPSRLRYPDDNRGRGDNDDEKKDEVAMASESAKDLMELLLQPKAMNHPSAEEALKHAWFRSMEKRKPPSLDEILSSPPRNLSSSRELSDTVSCSASAMDNMLHLNNLRKHNPNSRLKQAVCVYMGTALLTPEEDAKVDAVFSELDIVRDGTLTRDEVRAGFLLAFQKVLTEDEVEDIFRRVDSDGNGTVDRSEFAVASIGERDLLCPDRLKLAFDRFDQHKDGYICPVDLRSIPAFSNYSKDELDFVIAEVDLKGHGKIDFKCFVEVLTGSGVY